MKNTMKQISFLHAYDFAAYISRGIKGISPESDELADYIDYDSDDFLLKSAQPNKRTILHDIIYSIVFNNYDYFTGHFLPDAVDEMRSVFIENGCSIPAWLNDEEVEDHIKELDNLLIPIVDKIVTAVFHLLFSDRNFCFMLQKCVLPTISSLKKSDHPNLLKKDGVFKRVNYIPTWLKIAVFHRDKGRCQLCWKDLTGLMNPIKEIEYDHMIPLDASGTNDPTNYQIVCKSCNQKKWKNTIVERQRLYTYW